MNGEKFVELTEEQFSMMAENLRQQLIALESKIDVAAKKHDTVELLNSETRHQILRTLLRVLESSHRDPTFLERKAIQPEIRPVALALLQEQKSTGGLPNEIQNFTIRTFSTK